MDTSRPIIGTTSSTPTQSGVRFEALLRLGERLLEELKGEGRPDTLTRWMAHYLAERISEINAATGIERKEKERVCADEILKFWEHRRSFPGKARPFEDYDAVLRTLESLDLNDRRPRYFRYLRESENVLPEDSECKKWIQVAVEIDSAAKVIIRHCLSLAASTSEEKSREWVVLAEECGQGDEVDVQVIRRLLGDEDSLDNQSSVERERGELEATLGKLQAFESIALGLSQILREQLTDLPHAATEQATADDAGEGRGKDLEASN
jgi:hypothetical protein